MQQKCRAIYILLLLSLASWEQECIFVNAQIVNASGSSPAPGTGLGTSIVGIPAPIGSTVNASGGIGNNSTPVIPPVIPVTTPGVTSSPIPGGIGSGTTPNTSSGTPGASIPTPGSTAAGSVITPPAPGSTATGSIITPPAAPGSTATGNISNPPAPGSTGGNPASPGPGTNAAYVMPVPDETAIDVRSRDECSLASALFGALGSKSATPCTSGSNGSSGGKKQTLNEYTGNTQRSSDSNRGGLVTTSVGAQFCVSTEGAEALAAEANKLSFRSTSSLQRDLPDIHDPACDDPDADLRQGCPDPAPPASFYKDVTSNGGGSQLSPDDTTKAAAAAAAAGDSSPPPDANTQLADCARKFLRVGSAPRSVAIILLKWDRKYYKTKEDCCTEQGNPPNCDCNWSGYTYDNLPPPKAYSKYFTDECDQGPSINRGYYDLSGGKVTFHSKLRVPIPRNGVADTTPKPVSNSSDVTSSPASSGPPPPASLSETPAVPGQPVETANSYLDPEGVDVYGWATLSDMRNDAGLCKDWCGDAMKQLNVNDKDYNHIVCLQLLASKALCDVCDGDCVGTCPAATGITSGCGCATCYYAWGGQASCHRPSSPGIRVGMGANTRTYDGEMVTHAGGPLISVTEQLKRYVTHEIGHNMGLTHTGTVRCKVNGDSSILREPQQCSPDWYGDTTSFMGTGGTMLVPNALRYKLRWLPRTTLKTHPQGEERSYVLRASTTRRPSWQSKSPPGWFTRADTLTVRVQLRNPAGSKQDVGGYTCPCSADGACPTCAKTNPGACDNGPCCLDEQCADDGLNWMYIELHQAYRNDYESTMSGVAIRMMGDVTNCTSTRLVPAYATGGRAKYLLTQPDPAGQKAGSKYEDLFRGVRVTLESWDKARAVVKIWSA